MQAYSFKVGAPPSVCRPFSADEIEKMRCELLGDRTELVGKKPVAVLISGLPGGGKSSTVDRFFADELESSFDTNAFVRLDFDKLRSFHQQYVSILHPSDSIDNVPTESYYDLVPWFIEGTDFENVLFKSSDGLIHEIFNRRLSFSMETILDNEGCFRFVQYARARDFQVILVHIHIPLQEAIRRAEERAYRTGRWSSPEYIGSREAGIVEWFLPISHFLVNECEGNGSVLVYDNSVRGKPAVLVYHSRQPSISQIDPSRNRTSIDELHQLYQLALLSNNTVQLDLLHKSHTERAKCLHFFAEAFVGLIFPTGLFPSSLSLAGGCFKSLVTGKMPRDFDIWPHTKDTRNRLLTLLEDDPRAHLERTTRFNYQYVIRILPEERARLQSTWKGVDDVDASVLHVDVVVFSKPTLQEVLDGFDMAISAAGVAFTNGVATEHSLHRDFAPSFLHRTPLLIDPMPNVPFMLATAELWRTYSLTAIFLVGYMCATERVVRYCTELGFDWPADQMAILKAIFGQQSADRKKAMIAAWQEVSRDGEAYRVVYETFHDLFPV